jgi:hypothetical protein
VNFASILKRVGQYNILICLLDHGNDFDQSNKSPSTRDMTTPHYAVTLSDTIRRPLILVSIDVLLSFVYAQKGNSTEVQIYRTISSVTWANIVF